MPYMIYKIFAERRLEYVDAKDSYREAKEQVRAMRKAQTAEDGYLVRMIYAKNQEEAERLLTEVREAPPMGDD